MSFAGVICGVGLQYDMVVDDAATVVNAPDQVTTEGACVRTLIVEPSYLNQYYVNLLIPIATNVYKRRREREKT